MALGGAPALLGPGAFSGGPILLANNALAWGGAERQVVNTLMGLKARGSRSLGLLCLKLGEGADYDFYASALSGIGIVRNMALLDPAKELLRSSFSSPQLAPIENVLAPLPGDVRERIWRLLGDFIALRPCVVHAWQDAMSVEAGYAAKLAGVPRIIVSSRNMAPVHFAYHRPYMRDGYLALANCPDVIMLNNSNAGAQDYADWLGIAPERLQIVRNGIDLTALANTPGDVRALLGIGADAPLIGSIFRFYSEKRPLLWMETAAKVAAVRKDAHFVIFGVGPLMKEARAFAEREGFGARFHTPGALADAAHMLHGLDVFLLTSEFEGTPNVVLEASASGVPVVATDAGGTAEAIEAGITGFVAAPEVAKLAEKVLAILSDGDFRRRCAAAGPLFVEQRFGLARMIDETLQVYGLRD
jgi:glycosyltransferase involved in cell wall biosynthesis